MLHMQLICAIRTYPQCQQQLGERSCAILSCGLPIQKLRELCPFQIISMKTVCLKLSGEQKITFD
uniref:GLX2-4 n=2 Tax=Arundo donax TaxID=35708 RepID=A0A0A9DA61_ARUDO